MTTLTRAIALVLGGLSIAGCASVTPDSAVRGSLDALPLTEHPALAAERMDNGVRVVRIPAAGDTFEAGILFSGGPLLDPPERPGLTEWTVRTAVLGTEGDDVLAPEGRALELGVTLIPVSHGSLFGWVVQGPKVSESAAIALLADLAQRPSFPATAMQVLGARERQRIEASGDESLNTMLAVAIGFSLGLNRPLHLEPPATLFDATVREDAVRHWRRWFRPSRAVFVTTAEGSLSSAWSDWRESGPVPTTQPVCTPHGRTAHHLLDTGRDAEDTIALFAAAVPGLGSPSRRALGGWFTALAERPAGPVASVVGLEQARRAAPSIVDLATGPGASISVALSATRGSAEQALGDLLQVAALWRPPAQRPADESVSGSLDYLSGERLVRSEQPVARCILAAEEALFGRASMPTNRQALVLARSLLEPWRYTFVGLGGALLAPRLEEIAPVNRWDSSGQAQGDVTRTRCEHSPDG